MPKGSRRYPWVKPRRRYPRSYSNKDRVRLLSEADKIRLLEPNISNRDIANRLRIPSSTFYDLIRKRENILLNIKDLDINVNATIVSGAKGGVIKEKNENEIEEDEVDVEEIDVEEVDVEEVDVEEVDVEKVEDDEDEDEYFQLECTSSSRPTSQRKPSYTDAERRHYIQRLDRLRRKNPNLSVSDAAIQCGIAPSIARELIRSRARRLLQILEVPSDRERGGRQRLRAPYPVKERRPQQKSALCANCAGCI
ncbi:hypothetical protein BGZ51_003885 [Haplosporangium sp. Z 767]|nr:hypothetical protein BGZ51_003885 [Haplosporangium sp. Z 767]KAF9194942.1 hypothetical protein BGZ50_005408 [Haplosporangium sp. Z 11]